MTDNCTAHHWLIEPPAGPLSEGTCKHCGETRMFQNRSPDFNSYWLDRGKKGAKSGHQSMGHKVDAMD